MQPASDQRQVTIDTVSVDIGVGKKRSRAGTASSTEELARRLCICHLLEGDKAAGSLADETACPLEDA